MPNNYTHWYVAKKSNNHLRNLQIRNSQIVTAKIAFSWIKLSTDYLKKNSTMFFFLYYSPIIRQQQLIGNIKLFII